MWDRIKNRFHGTKCFMKRGMITEQKQIRLNSNIMYVHLCKVIFHVGSNVEVLSCRCYLLLCSTNFKIRLQRDKNICHYCRIISGSNVLELITLHRPDE